jgi:hypothetical protein
MGTITTFGPFASDAGRAEMAWENHGGDTVIITDIHGGKTKCIVESLSRTPDDEPLLVVSVLPLTGKFDYMFASDIVQIETVGA